MEVQQKTVQGCLPVGVDGICLKPLIDYLKLISSKWMIILIMAFPPDSTPMRYNRIKSQIGSITSKRISDTTLSSRLSELVSKDILIRKQFNEIPPHVEYHLTTKGRELQQSLQPLINWAIKDCHAEIKR
ncbi:MAG: winged helix-turn-helix transcriptional regulator [Candidatus Hodarchaeales archaeon]